MMKLIFLLKNFKFIFIFLINFFPTTTYGFWDELIQNNQNQKNPSSSILSTALNEIFGPLPPLPSFPRSKQKILSSHERQQQIIFIEKRGTNIDDEEDGEDENGGGGQQPSDGGISLIGGGGPGGNAAIVCPSGNRVYVHPISGDLQQCSQQLGFYNQTTCPGGTVCERFPILIPGFQDYCCWGNDTSESETLIIGTSTESSITDSISGPESSGSGNGGIGVGVISSGGYTDSPFPFPTTTSSDNSDESEWIVTTTSSAKTKRTRRPRPRSRKTSASTTEAPTTTTTTMQPRTPSPRRGPRCQNPDDAALIDFGNRLRDCYYQQCPYNYRCEFNSDIRRYICCGKERGVFPPAGLPPLPEPQPVVPRPFRPRLPPPYLHGEEVENPLISSRTPFLETNDEGNDENQVTEPTCPLNHEHRGFLGGVSFCEPDNLSLICPVSHPYCLQSDIWGATVCCKSGPTWQEE